MASSSRYEPLSSYPPLPTPVSRSDKGKGRATRDDDESTSTDDGDQGLSVGVRFTDGQTQDLVDLWVGARESVRDLKRRVSRAFTREGVGPRMPLCWTLTLHSGPDPHLAQKHLDHESRTGR